MAFMYFDFDEETGEVIVGEMKGFSTPVTNIKRVDQKDGFSMFFGDVDDKESDNEN